MANNETERFTWPLPAWNADWQKWQEVFADLIRNIDSDVFAVMSSSRLIMKQLPNVEIVNRAGDLYLEMDGDAIFVSRTHLAEITLAQEDVLLQANSVLALTMTPGAVGPQSIGWETYPQGIDNAPEVIPVGYVDGSYNIIWFNGAELASGGGPQGLFEFPGGSGSAADKVRISAADTLANYLGLKLAAGTNVVLTTLNVGGNEQLQISAPAASVPTGVGFCYVDDANGSDIIGDGSIGNPFKTFTYACAAQGAPASYADFVTPIVFNLAPGTYSGGATIPKRLHVKVVGDDCLITGGINWGIDPQMWSTYAVPLDRVPVLHFAQRNPAYGAEVDSSVTALPQGFRISGLITVATAVTGSGSPMPDSHTMMLTGVFRDACHIYNSPAGTGVENDAPGPMNLYLRDSWASSGVASRIVGEVDRDLGTMAIVTNEIRVHAVRSSVNMCGTCGIALLDNCEYSAAWDVDYAGAPYLYGNIGGYGDAPGENIRNSRQLFASTFGCDITAPAPAHAGAQAIIFDKDSLVDMVVLNTDLSTSFVGFKATNVGAYTRGWWNGYAEAISGQGRLSVPCPNADDAFRLFSHTYSVANNWLIDGAPLAAGVRLVIELESGGYTVPKTLNFTFDQEYVDVMGHGSSVLGTSEARPSVIFNVAGNHVYWAATDAHLENIQFMQLDTGAGDVYCMEMASRGSNSVFKNISFSECPGSVGSPYAVLIDPLLGASVQATWEDCNTELDRFLFGGDVAGSLKRCWAGNYSFGGWTGIAPLSIVCSASLEDCHAGDYSFAGTDSGGDTTFSGEAHRCFVSSFGFASSMGGVGPYTATCGGVLIDCQNYSTGGSGSFGCSETGDGIASATLLRCFGGTRSFGYSDDAAGVGSFAGEAEDCSGGYYCFGANGSDPTSAMFIGVATDCDAGYGSFGHRGAFSGSAIRCTASYGSFGDQVAAATSAVLDGCTVTDIRNGANTGPPGVHGGLVRNCKFLVRATEVIAPLILNGGTGATATRVFGCDLYGDSIPSSIYAAGAVDAQVAHCRMNVDLDANVTNLLAVPYNMLDAAYNPS